MNEDRKEGRRERKKVRSDRYTSRQPMCHCRGIYIQLFGELLPKLFKDILKQLPAYETTHLVIRNGSILGRRKMAAKSQVMNAIFSTLASKGFKVKRDVLSCDR